MNTEGGRPGDGLVAAVDIMDRLWAFGGWETTQTHASLTRYLVEETYEVLDAVAGGDPQNLRDELGDLLLQVLFHSRIAAAAGEFDVDDVADALVAKLTRRSPQLAEDWTGPVDVAAQEQAWEAAKTAEKTGSSCLDGIAMTQPALALAEKVIDRATRAGLPAELIPDELRVVRIGDNAEARLRSAVLALVDRIQLWENELQSDC